MFIKTLQKEQIAYLFQQFLIKPLCLIITLPVSFGIIIISPIIRIRLIRLRSFRIGHLALNTELMRCALQVNLHRDAARIKTFFYLPTRKNLCNLQLYLMWKRTVGILPFPLLCAQVDKLLIIFGGKFYYNDPVKEVFDRAEDRWDFLETVKQRLSFNTTEHHLARCVMQKLGIKQNAQYVCLLMRDSNYLKVHLSQDDWSYHNYRDVDSENYKQAAQYLAEQGYYVIRMGKYVGKEFNINHPLVIDYANSSLQSDFMDIYLTAHCFFMISTSCGLDSVAQIFRKPLLITDFPLPDLAWYRWTLFIPKKIVNLKTNQFLKFNEIYKVCSILKSSRTIAKILQENNLGFIDNTPDEILAAVKETLLLLKNNPSTSSTQAPCQTQFWENFPLPLPESTHSYANVKFHIAESFLKLNPTLLDES